VKRPGDHLDKAGHSSKIILNNKMNYGKISIICFMYFTAREQDKQVK